MLFYSLPTAVVLIALAWALRLWRNSKRNAAWSNNSPRAPPHVTSYIPWLGNALSLASDPEKFFKKCHAKYGPIFSVTLAGKTNLYAASEAVITYIYRNPKDFVFSPIRREMQVSVFGLNQAADSDWMENSLFPAHKRFLSPGNIGKLVDDFAVHTLNDMQGKHQSLGSNGEVVDVSEIVYSMIFSASSKAFFGASFPSINGFDGFLGFDEAFPLLAGGLPGFMCKKGIASRNKAMDILEEWLQDLYDREAAGKKISPDEHAFYEIVNMLREEHFSRRDQASLLLGDSWALLANAPQAAIWNIIKLIEHPEALARVRTEIDIGLGETDDGKIETLLRSPTVLTSETFGFTNSVIQETLRTTSSSFSIRRVVHDTIIPFPVGTPGTLVKKDDVIVCVGSVNHWDANLYSNPNEWIAERFTTEFKKGRAERGEKDVPNAFLPFGSGVSICEGRHFAMSELRIALISFLYHFDVQKMTEKPAQLDYSRVGLGIMPVKGKYQLRLRPRALGARP